MRQALFKVRDLRKRDQYKIDDTYLNGYAKHCGIYATAVYNSLSRHADFYSQKAFPSIDLIAKQHGINRKSVIKGIKQLEKYCILQTAKEKDARGRQKNNLYILIDKSDWLPYPKDNQVPVADMAHRVLVEDIPSPRGGKSRVPTEDCKDTHIKDNTIKVCETGVSDAVKKKEKSGNPLKDESPQDLTTFVESCRASPQRHVRLIGEYADQKQVSHTTKGQWQSFINRNVKAAVLLSPYTDEQIGKAMASIAGAEKSYLKKWSLETLSKYLEN